MSETEPAPPRMSDSSPRLVGGLLLATAVGAVLLAREDFRAVAMTQSLAVAGSAGAPAARREAALREADAALAAGVSNAELYDLAASRALLGGEPDLDRAEALTRDALRRSPARSSAWARLAYIDLARDGELSPDGVEALARSYEAEPFAAEALRRWRIEFVLSRWRDMPEALRTSAVEEAQGSARGARWYEETVWLYALAERLPEPAAEAIRAAVPPPPG